MYVLKGFFTNDRRIFQEAALHLLADESLLMVTREDAFTLSLGIALLVTPMRKGATRHPYRGEKHLRTRPKRHPKTFRAGRGARQGVFTGFPFHKRGWGLIVVLYILREDVLQGGKHFLRIRIGRKGDKDVSLATMGLEDALNVEKAVEFVNERALLKRLKGAKDGCRHTRAALANETNGDGCLLVRRCECYWMHNELILF